MTNSGPQNSAASTSGYESAAFAIPLLAHMAVADEQLHSAEIAQLSAVIDHVGVDDGMRQYVRDILGGRVAQDAISHDIAAVPESARDMALRWLVAMAYADGTCADSEHRLLSQVCAFWRVPDAYLAKLHEHAKASILAPWMEPQSETQPSLSLAARTMSILDTIVSSSGTDVIASLLPVSVRDRMKCARHELLLKGSDYDEAVDLCARISREDFEVAAARIREATEALHNLQRSLNEVMLSLEGLRPSIGAGEALTGALEALSQSRDQVNAEGTRRLVLLMAALEAKKRAIDCFTIAFMGKTKAGKSTLHAIVTGEGHDAIGIGEQRTTRYNRVYHWRSIRIIDTPGIGAPGGKTDEQIASSIVDEADVICYVVTNDSQQVTELNFLHRLKERAKPLVVLLNVKHNLTEPVRLRRFLANPNKLFELEGESGLQGHIDRIRRFAKERYGNDHFPIIPVLLLAAQLGGEEPDSTKASCLRKGSRIDDFLNSLRVSVIEHGAIRRSQTILACSADDIHRINGWISGARTGMSNHSELLQRKQSEAARMVWQAHRDASMTLTPPVAKTPLAVRNS